MTIIIITIKELEYTKQVMHNAIAHHLMLTDAQLVPEQQSPPQANSPQFIYWA